MGVATSQQISKYYELYRDTEIIFTKDVINVTHLDPRQVYLKCTGSQWPCILNSSSLMAAKIIIGTKSGGFTHIQKDSSPVSIRFCFQDPDNLTPISFFVTSRVSDIKPYGESQDLAIVTLSFTQRPPDDLIEILGAMQEANINSVKRREERIPITPDSLRRLNIGKKETVLFIQNVPRRCILRELSFNGAKVILMGLAPFLLNKETVLRIEFEDPRAAVNLVGKVTGTEEIEGRKDLLAVTVSFVEKAVPIVYKMHINTVVTQIRKKQQPVKTASSEQQVQEAQARQIKAADAEVPSVLNEDESGTESVQG